MLSQSLQWPSVENTESLTNVIPKPAVGQNIAMHASPTVLEHSLTNLVLKPVVGQNIAMHASPTAIEHSLTNLILSLRWVRI